ncbi:MAG: endonuclease, partial [Arthrobacter sp.]
MDRREAVEAFEAFKASVAALGAVLYGAGSAGAGSAGSGDVAGGDPLRQWSDDCLDGLVHIRRADAQSAALKVRLAAGYADAERAMVSPVAGPQERKVNEMAIV